MRKFLVLLRGLKWKWWTAGVLVVIVAAGFAGWRIHRHDDRTSATPLTATVTSGTQRQTVAASGTIEPAKTADLDFSVSGTVTHVYVKAGQHVTKGQRLASVDPTSLDAARSAAQASYDAAVSQQSQDAADGASAVQLASDQAAVVSAKASLESAREDVDDAVLRATITGTVTAQDLTVGQVVGSSTPANASDSTGSSAEVSLASSRTFIVDATVAATDAASIKDGMQAQVTVTGDDSTIYGTVGSVGLVAQTDDEGAAVFPVTIDITGAQTGLYAGTSATASIIVKQVPNVLTVTSQAIQSSNGSTYVEKIVGGRTVKTPVKIGTVYGATTQILSGLEAGDEVQIPGFSLSTSGGSSSLRTRLGSFTGGSFPSGFGGSGTFKGGFGGASFSGGFAGVGGGQ